jgi:hypothetical protein
MSTSAQVHANQQNAAHSTGPSSPAGKAASSQNATSHGLTGHFAVLPHEDLAAFYQVQAGYRKTFKPTNDHEDFLVETMVESRWKLARLKRMESALVQQMAGQDTEHSNPDAVVAAAMLAGNANAYASLQRYQAAAERSYYKAKQELDRGRAHSAQPETKCAAKQEIHAVQNEPKSPTRPSQNVLDYLRPNVKLEDLTKLSNLCKPAADKFSPADFTGR